MVTGENWCKVGSNMSNETNNAMVLYQMKKIHIKQQQNFVSFLQSGGDWRGSIVLVWISDYLFINIHLLILFSNVFQEIWFIADKKYNAEHSVEAMILYMKMQQLDCIGEQIQVEME